MNILIHGVNGGIGRALADLLRDRFPAANVLTSSRQRSAHTCLAMDFEDESSIARAAGEISERVGRLHWLINAAGMLHGPNIEPEKKIEQFDPQVALRVMAVNAVGPMLVAKHFLPLLSHAEPAVFASVAARVGSIGDNRLGGWYSYRASKAALVMLMKTLAIEASRRSKNLVCFCLHPGTVATPLSAPFQSNVRDGQLFSPSQSAGYLLDILSHAGPQHHGRHVAWDGQFIDW